jgi:Tfp pilus assembly pilus retraction ATPase PilT
MEVETSFFKLLEYVEINNLSDIHFSTGSFPMVRESNGDIENIAEFLV